MIKDFITEKSKYNKQSTKIKTIQFLFEIIKPHWILLTAVILLIILAAALELISIGLIFPLINNLISGGSLSSNTPLNTLNNLFQDFSAVESIRLIALTLLLLQSTKALLLMMSKISLIKLHLIIDKTLRIKVLDDLLLSGLTFLNKTSVAENFTILNQFTGHTARLSLQITSIINPVIMSIMYLTALFVISWQLTLISAIFISITTFSMSKITRITGKIAAERNRAAIKLNQLGFEILSGIKHIQLFTKEKHLSDAYKTGIENVNSKSYKSEKYKAYASPIYQISNITSAVVLIMASTIIYANQKEMLLGIILTYLFVMLRLISPLSSLNSQRLTIANLIPSMVSLRYFIDRKDKEFTLSGSKRIKDITQININNLSFKYSDEDNYVLKNINLRILKGSKTAIVGASGSGKSTLVNLILRLYEPDGGQILANQTEINKLDLKFWRSNVGMVSQNTFVFNDSIENNIRFAKLNATEPEVIAACKNAYAHEFISKMKDGYKTIVGDQGVRLSGGESQRIAIARTLLYNPQVIILDEATSSLDAESEKFVQQAIDNLSTDRTVISIAHRLSTIKDADSIIVLNSGTIVEQGTHNELMKEKNLYYSYVKLQSVEPINH